MTVSLWAALLQLPGLWLMLACAGGYAYLTGSTHLGPRTLGVMLAIVLVAELIETFAAAGGARRAGASKTAMLASVIGAFIGGILFTLLPVPVVGTLLGVCVGAFIGAMAVEVAKGRGHKQSIRSGLGAAAGRLAGTLIKLALGAVVFLIAAVAALPL